MFNLIKLSAFLLLSAFAIAQSPPPAPCSSVKELADTKPRDGATMIAELDKDLNTKKLRVGDEVTATTSNDVIAGGESLLIGSTVFGRVVCVGARSNGDSQSVLALVFDRAQMKSGKRVKLESRLQAVIAPDPARFMGPGDTDFQGRLRITGGLMSTSGKTLGGTSGGIDKPIEVTPKTSGVLGIKNVEASTANPAAGAASSSAGTGAATAVPKEEPPVVVTSRSKSVKLEASTRFLIKVWNIVVPQ